MNKYLAAGIGAATVFGAVSVALLRRRPRNDGPSGYLATTQDWFGDEGGCPVTEYQEPGRPVPTLQNDSREERPEEPIRLDYAIAAGTP